MLGHHEIFARFTFNREWDVAELSFAKFMAQVTRENSDIIGLPVICSRLFRFSSFYVNKKSNIQSPQDLKGKRVGSPEWAHTAAVYMRGWLGDEHGVKLPDIHWVQAGANEAGRVEKVESNLPKGVEITRIEDKSLSECSPRARSTAPSSPARPTASATATRRGAAVPGLLADGGGILRAHQGVADHAHHRDAEGACSTAIPGSRAICYNAFLESKRRSVERLSDPAVSRYPLAWLPAYARKMRDMFDGDPFPFGIDENRPTLEQFARYTFEQGIAHRLAKPEEIFPQGVMTMVRV